MEKHTLTFVGRYTTKKDGSPLIGSNGKPYTSLRIKTNAHGDKYLSGFDNASTKDWKVGDTVEIEVEEKGEYLNFSVPKAPAGGSGLSQEHYQRISTELAAIKWKLDTILSHVDPAAKLTSAGTPVPDFTPKTMNEEIPDFRPEDLPPEFR